MVENEKNVGASPDMGTQGAEHLQARDCSPGGPSRVNSMQQKRVTAIKFKGVRMREPGKWVTEINDVETRRRIWLGSFETEEMAARAYNSAVVSLKGPNAAGLNFPHSLPQFVSQSRAPKDIQAAAAQAAAGVSARNRWL
jgi:hypothetical protein